MASGISSTTNRVTYAGDGTSATFAFQYNFTSTADLTVYLYDTIAAGIVAQVLNGGGGTGYTISGTQNTQGIYVNGGNVIFNSSPVNTSIVVIDRNPSPVQNLSIQTNGTIPSTALVNQLNYLTLLLQRQQELNSRSATLPDGMGSSFNTTLPATMILNASSCIITNATATGFAMGPSVATIASVVPNAAAAAASAVAAAASAVAAAASAAAPQLTGPAGYVLTANGSSAATYQQSAFGANSSLIQYGIVYASSATQLSSTGTPGVGSVLTGNGSSPPTFVAPVFTSTKTASYNVLTTDTYVLVASAAFNVVLYPPAGNAGKIVTIRKTDTTPGNNSVGITINGTSTILIDGLVSTTLNTLNESITLLCDGSNWSTLNRRIPAFTNSSVLSPQISGFGVATGSVANVRRVGDSLYCTGNFVTGSSTAAQAQIALSYLSSGDVQCDDTRVIAGTLIGQYSIGAAGTNGYPILSPTGTNNIVLFGQTGGGNNPLSVANGNQVTVGQGLTIEYFFTVPILGWKG